MKHGFVKVGAASVDIAVANPDKNAREIIRAIESAAGLGAKLLALPELCITGYTCGDLFFMEALIAAAERALFEIVGETSGLDIAFAAGLPLKHGGKLYSAAAVCHRGKVLGIVPKSAVSSQESRHFSSGSGNVGSVQHVFSNGERAIFGPGLVFAADNMADFAFGVEIGDDLIMACPPGADMCARGAKVILNLSASGEIIGRAESIRGIASSASGRLQCAYVRAGAAPSESTQDMVFSAHNMIYEKGALLAENEPFGGKYIITADVDLGKLSSERLRAGTHTGLSPQECESIPFSPEIVETRLERSFRPEPFIPEDPHELSRRCELVLKIQAHGLKKRIQHTGAQKIMIAISGGLDSALALLVMVRAMNMLNRSRKDILAITMPCFGTTQRTKSNAQRLCELLKVDFREIDISKSVRQHFKDIGLEEGRFDAAYENAQARERTQVMMDVANMENGLMVGPGDLSELALGWTTYNGDHMSMYAVNASVPKTMVRHIVRHEAALALAAGNGELSAVLLDIVQTPVSPELLPPKDGEIQQRTEDIIGPYELHDFFLYYTVRFGFSPEKILRIAKLAFSGLYGEGEIKKWLELFLRRFFSQQFKRSCLPDGVKVGSVSLSPRGDWSMPSDARAEIFLDDIL
ncbi:MAG: NAD(+) synthase [Christensenellales bacterium]|jgi:NAD+ synthase (glutamine-hydrolysing)